MSSAVPTTPRSHRILIIESDTTSADALANLLEEEGHDSQIATDAKTSLLMLNDFNPDLVLLGTYLADMPGYELTVILRDAPQFSGKFRRMGLLYVADRDKIVNHRMFGAPQIPMSQYIFKPIDSAEVREKILRELAKQVSQNITPI
jgi:PleD family two-component response regulator